MATANIESILISIKKLLGIVEEDESFDDELVIHINSVFFTLYQLGVGPKGFSIEDETATWETFLEDREDLQAVRSYIYLRVRLMFDPPQMGYLVESMKKQCEEFEWRLNVQVEEKQEEEAG